MEKTPSGLRAHIGFLGRTNAGKSALVNALAGIEASLVSPQPGTTTDPVRIPMEFPDLGAVTLLDTAGLLDDTPLGTLREERTRQALRELDLAVMLLTSADWAKEGEMVQLLQKENIPCLFVVPQMDLRSPAPLLAKIRAEFHAEAVPVSIYDPASLAALRERIREFLRPEERWITKGIASADDLVVLVMPQDASAPKGRLILPQVQTLRELLDRGIPALCVTPQTLIKTLEALREPPEVIITDSQCFNQVAPLVPSGTKLTSFSILFASYKGDAQELARGARILATLKESSRVLIAEACTHAPKEEDIGTVKIPALLRQRIGSGLTIDHVRGSQWPHPLEDYDLIIQCGSCMFNRAHVLHRIQEARRAKVPITNYGMALAYLTGILDRVDLGEGTVPLPDEKA
ncbi:[FeFe]-hydrogenase maturation GTPase HydF [Clostridiaceae bacterium JG1575]|nr:[FeFe]-hydrogenase maturation GTPase HydF [Clostridiaceae bacterium JG1575]